MPWSRIGGMPSRHCCRFLTAPDRVCNLPDRVRGSSFARMKASTEHVNLDERSRRLLKSLVERYITDGQPVGSRVLARSSGLGVSAATVRNVMADLEDLGYVAAPHTSAGRIPTVLGYRFFIDALLHPEPLDARQAAALARSLDAQYLSGGNVAESASRLLSSLSDMAGVVTVPRSGRATLRQIEFLPLSENRILAILVINERDVQNRIIQAERTYSASELERAGNFITERFSGERLPAIRSRLEAELNDMRSDLDSGMRSVLSMGGQLFEPDAATRLDYYLAGQTKLMEFPEFGEVERLRELFDALQQKQSLLRLFDDCLRAEGVRIYIGEESGYRVLDECSVVTAPYTVDGEVVGTLGVIGPTRMAYNRIIPLVDAAANLLGTALKSRN